MSTVTCHRLCCALRSSIRLNNFHGQKIIRSSNIRFSFPATLRSFSTMSSYTIEEKGPANSLQYRIFFSELKNGFRLYLVCVFAFTSSSITFFTSTLIQFCFVWNNHTALAGLEFSVNYCCFYGQSAVMTE